MIIKKVFENNCDQEVHNDFVKFSRGEFKDKYLVEAKNQNKKWSIKTSLEFTNFLVRSCLNSSPDEIKVSGILSTTTDLSSKIKFSISKVSQFQGVKKYVIDTTIKTQELITLMDEYPKVFYALSFKGDNFELKIKAKAPKSGKPGSKDEEAKADFCKLKTSDKKIIDDFFFDVGTDWTEAKLNHSFKITEIIYSENMSKMSPAEIRENSKRKIKLTRYITLDGNQQTKEIEFIA